MRGAPARCRRRPSPGARGWHAAARATRILGLLLALTGCAVEGPRPAALAPPLDDERLAVPAPIPLPVVSRFGEWRGEGDGSHPARHAGIDIRAPVGTPVLAAADGVVVRTGAQASAGRLVVLAHAEDLATVYFHLSRVTVAPGQVVRRGDVIGRVGASGNATAPHLHFGVCRRPGSLCGEVFEDGWENPARHWVAGNPCLGAAPVRRPEPDRLTYPLPCRGGGPAA